MLWLFLAIGAYFLFALVAMGDKALLGGPMKNPETYAASVGLLGVLLLLAAPFLGFPFPAGVWWIAMAGGASFIIALIPYFRGVRDFEVSRIVPATGGLVPIVTLLLLLAMLPDARSLGPRTLFAFIALVVGCVLLSRERGIRFSGAVFSRVALASLFFGGSFALLKVTYTLSSFWAGLLWYQLGMVACGLVLAALSPAVRSDLVLFMKPGRESVPVPRLAGLFFGVQAISAGASLLQSVAIYMAPPRYAAFVNALQGVQYIFILLLGLIFSRVFPHIFRERIHAGRLVGILCVVAGIVAIAF